MNSPFYDVPVFSRMPSPSNAAAAASAGRYPSPNPLQHISGSVNPHADTSHVIPTSLEELAARLGLRTPGLSTESPQRTSEDQLVSDQHSGSALISALMNGSTNSSSDADFIIDICNQDDLMITDPILVGQYKSKGIPRSTSALLDVLDENKTFKRTRLAFEVQLKTLNGPQLSNATNKFFGDIVSLLKPSARTALRLVILIMAQFRGTEHKAT
jgi:hypothetical protein